MSKKGTLADLDTLEAFFESHRWIQHNMSDMVGGYCLIGAAWAAGVGELCPELGKTIRAETLIQWNDTEGRTLADVKQLIADTRTRLGARTV